MDDRTFEAAFAVAERLESSGLPPGITSVTVGYKRTGGATTDRPALVFLVAEKLPASEVHPALAIPEEIEGFATDVVEARAELEDDRGSTPYDRISPLVGGVSIKADWKKSIGTLGAVFRHRTTGRPLGLTNRHVVDTLLFDADGQAVFQPREVAGNRIGIVQAHDKALDCASIAISEQQREVDRQRSFLGLQGRISAIGRAREEMLVFKVGARTGYTEGVVKSSGPRAVEIRPRDGVTGPRLSDRGDSGAIWACKTAAGFIAVALHWGGGTDVAYAKPLPEIARLLDLVVEP